MKYALNLEKDTGRILSATEEQYAPATAPKVDELPEGDLYDYRFVNGKVVYDPLPKETEQETPPSLEDRVGNLEIDSADMKEALEMILLGVTE